MCVCMCVCVCVCVYYFEVCVTSKHAREGAGVDTVDVFVGVCVCHFSSVLFLALALKCGG